MKQQNSMWIINENLLHIVVWPDTRHDKTSAVIQNKCKKHDLKIPCNNRDKRTDKFVYFHTPC
jgi:hypothetical protein